MLKVVPGNRDDRNISGDRDSHLLSSDQIQQFHLEPSAYGTSIRDTGAVNPILNPQEFPGFSIKHKQPLGLMASPKESEELAPQALT